MPRKVILATNFPENDDEFITFSGNLIGCLGSAQSVKNFPNLPVGVANLTTLYTNLQTANSAAKKGGAGTVTARKSARNKLEVGLRHDEAYVEATVADLPPGEQDPAIAASGFSRRKPSTHKKSDYGVTRGPTADSAVIDLKAHGRHGTIQYCHQYSINGKQSWIDLPPTLDTRITVTGLPSGTTVWFRYRTLVKGVYSDWSQEISYLVH